MKVLVPVKRVVDYEARIKVKEDGSGIETDGIKWIVNPFDEIAVEQAVRLKEEGTVTEVVVVGIGPSDAVTQLRYSMAMGADRAILVETDSDVDSYLAAETLAKVFEKESPNLVIMGKQAIDSDAGQTPQLLAEFLDLPQASYASKLSLTADSAEVVREVDGGLETMKVSLPAVISTDLRLNEPRYASLPGIMKAKKKPLEVIPLADTGVSVETGLKTVEVNEPEEREAGIIVKSVDELVDKLRNEAKVI